jgi:hypothetical protein
MKAGIRPAKFCELHQLRRYAATPGAAHCPVSHDFAACGAAGRRLKLQT